jgi:hypothetical protein
MHIEYWSFAAGYCKIKTARQKKRNPLKNKPLYKILEAVANDDL